MRWRTGLLTEIELDCPRTRQAAIRTDENTADLVHRLAQFHSDAAIAGILNRQGKTTAYGLLFTSSRVGNLLRHWNIPRFDPKTRTTDSALVNVRQAAEILGVAASTVHRWLNGGFFNGEQITPDAPWRIRITEAFRPQFMEQAPPGYVPMLEAMQRLGVTRQTVLQRVKRGELNPVHIRAERKRALRIKCAVLRGGPPLPVSVVGIIEFRLEDRFQPMRQRMLAHSIVIRRCTEWAKLPRLSRLRD